ncbi:(deoxy)nucleoside triphosphate pyrophosphohydrolase [Variovorax sp. J22P168]|nr:(deoxy)nucleoside triphosphate pyrophosphohydrolase [Variovorax sp. J22P168]
MADKTIRVAAAVIRQGGRYLLAKRPAHKAQGGFWEFPGGKIEQGETAQMALARELVEELDARNVTVGAPVGASVHDYGNSVVQIEAYWVTCDHASLRNLEHESIEWFAPTAFDQIALAPADKFLQPLLLVD